MWVCQKSAVNRGLSVGSWLHEKPVQFDMAPDVVNEAAEGPGVGPDGSGVGAEGSGKGETTVDETAVGEADAVVVGDGETSATLQPATRPKTARPTARLLMRPSRGRLC